MSRSVLRNVSSLALLALVAPSMALGGESAERSGTIGPVAVRCSIQNIYYYQGDFEFTYVIYDGVFVQVRGDRYRMRAPSTERHKANVDFRIQAWSADGRFKESEWVRSPDAMRQDNVWHAYNPVGDLRIDFAPVKVNVQTLFTFDQQLTDHGCLANDYTLLR